MISHKNAIIVLAATLMLFAPAVALCEVSDASDIVYEEASDEKSGFSFGQKPEQNSLTVTVLIILTAVLVIALILMLRLRKKMNGGHY